MLNELRGEVEKLCQMEERLKCAKKISAEITSKYNPEADNENNQCNLVEVNEKTSFEMFTIFLY